MVYFFIVGMMIFLLTKVKLTAKHPALRQSASLWMWGVKEKDMALYKLPFGRIYLFYFFLKRYISKLYTTCVVTVMSSGFAILITYSKYSSVSLFAVSASIPALRIVSTA